MVITVAYDFLSYRLNSLFDENSNNLQDAEWKSTSYGLLRKGGFFEGTQPGVEESAS